MTRTAILCIARNEVPYTEEWLEYHFSIGIDRVYYISTDTDFNSVEAFFSGSKFRSRVELLHFDDFKPGWQMRCYNTYFHLVEEDWVLVIDIDEFLYLNGFSGISEYLGTLMQDVGQIQFPWLILMSSNYIHSRVLDILGGSEQHMSDHVKSMVRRECSSGLGIHSHDTGRQKSCLSSGVVHPGSPKHSFLLDKPEYFSNHPFILHFCSRGHLDVLCRIIDHQFFNSKNGQGERERLQSYLLNAASYSNIPTRYLLMKFYASLPATNIDCPVPDLVCRTDLLALRQTFLSTINRIVDFNVSDLAHLEELFECRYGFAEKLHSQDISGMCDLDEYLKGSTQLHYIDRLRASLHKS